MKNNKFQDICLVLIISYLSVKLFDEISLILKVIFRVILPIILAFTLAFILYPLKKRIRRKINNNILSTGISVLVLFSIIVTIFAIIIPNVIDELILFVERVPNYLQVVENMYESFIVKHFNWLKLNIEVTLKSLISRLFEGVIQKIIQSLQTIISYSISFFISFFISIYLLYDYENILDWIKNKTKQQRFIKIRTLLTELNQILHTFIKGLIKVNGTIFILASCLFLMINLDLPVVLALLFAITNVIPYLGPYIGGSLAVIIGLNNDIKTAVLAFVIVILLQFFDNYILTPRIQGSKYNIKPVVLLISTIIFGSLFGIIGMILTAPIICFLQSFYNIYLNKN